MPGIDILQLLNGSEGLSDLAPIVATELECGDATLLKVVELLSTWLTNPDKEQRRQGTSLLSDILKIIPCSLLNEKECLFMVSFFCDRLMDHYSIIPFALEGLAALSGMDNFSDESPKEIIGALQENVTCQALTQEQRNVFYTIMYNLLVKKSELISTNFPSEYMYALVSGMDSESDPRNLLFLFSFLPKAFSEVPLKHLAEEAFAVLECYFPVDFTPVQEKGNVTREDLALGLEACFIASSAFAEFCIPMVCDKLESTLKIAQLDSLRLVINGFKNWNIESTDALIKRLWFSIKDVLIPGNDAEVASLAGEALVSILSAYSKAALSETEAKSLNFLLENVLSSTFSYLSDPSLSLFLPTSKLLSDVIAVSSTTAGFILPRVLSQLLALLEMDSKQKDLILKALAPILVSSVKFNAWENGLCEDILKKLLPIILTSIEDEKCGGSGFSCLTSIISKLSDDVRLSLYVSLKKILSSKSFPTYRKEFAIFLRTLCEEHPIEVEKHLISSFHIPEELDLQARNYLELLTWTMDYPNLIEAAAAVLSNHITMNELAVWRKDAVFVLRDYIIKADVKILVLLGTECDFPQKLLVSYINATDMNEDEVECVADIVTRIVRVLDAGLQISILRNGLELFHSNIPVNEYSPNKLVLLEGVACGLGREVNIPNSLQLCEFLIECSISSSNIVTTTSAARLLAVFINKMNNDSDLDRVLKLAKSKIQGYLSISSVRLSAWITKSLILRGYSPVCDDWLGELLHLVSSEEYGIAAAEGLNLLLEESRFLSEANHCNIGLLYRQRVFQKIELIIPENGKPSKSESLALAYILKYSPTSLVLGIIGQLTGVMVHCLKSDDSSVVLAILAILSHLLESSVDILRTLAETFIPQCIFLAQSSPYMLVRQDALNCLYLYGKYNSVDMLPYKNTVLTGLQKCLDDKKRLVRQCAVKTRTRWFLI